ncbi:MAG TPA: glutamine synthetase [Rhizobium sp.]
MRDALKDLNAENVHLGIFDLDGLFRHKQVDAGKAAKLAAGGYQFCDVIYAWDSAEKTYDDNTPYIDRPCAVDVASLRQYPFGDGSAIAIADFTGDFGNLSPRNQLVKMLDKAAELGFDVLSAFEFEFFVLQETPDTLREKGFRGLDHFAKANRTYSLQSTVLYDELFTDLRNAMARMGIGMDSIHTELGPGCFEVPLAVERGLRSADNAALFKNFAKAFFLRRDLTAAFMSKLSPDLPGQSGHLHVSLRSRHDDSAVFSDPSAADGLSQTARHFIGGLVRLMPEMLAMCSHTINAYRRMVPGMWAPTASNWGIQNRTAAVRVINDTPEATRVEFRVPSADTNPFSALAMCLGAGLYGIENRIEPPAPIAGVEKDAPVDLHLPADLLEAAARLEQSKAARALFGNDFVDHFVLSRRKEVEAFRRHVTDWEIRRYIEIL